MIILARMYIAGINEELFEKSVALNSTLPDM